LREFTAGSLDTNLDEVVAQSIARGGHLGLSNADWKAVTTKRNRFASRKCSPN
jgi:hypothetical protein